MKQNGKKYTCTTLTMLVMMVNIALMGSVAPRCSILISNRYVMLHESSPKKNEKIEGSMPA